MAAAEMPTSILQQVRAITAELAEVTEAPSHAAIAFKVGRRNLMEAIAVHDQGGGVVSLITVRTDPDEVQVLGATGHPFFIPRSGNSGGVLGVLLDDRTDWAEVRELIIESYCTVAPKRLVAQTLDALGD